MAEKTEIAWTDSTFNPWWGCSKVGPGCDHCYAEALDKRTGGDNWGAAKIPRVMSADNWRKPKQWNKAAKGAAERPRVFCASLADWLDDEVPIEWLANLLNLIRTTPNLDWLLLTKRIGNWRGRLQAAVQWMHDNKWDYDLAEWIVNWCAGSPPANVWLGETVCNQDELDRDFHKLLAIPAGIRFLSIEPMLGNMDLRFPTKLWAPGRCNHCCNGDRCDDPTHFSREKCPYCRGTGNQKIIDWVIVGGESGPGARPMHPDWVRSLRDQCAAAGTAFFFKQWGEWLPGELIPGKTTYARCDTGEVMKSNGRSTRDNFMTHPDKNSGELIALKIGKKNSGRLLDGIEWNQFPGDAI